MTSKTAQNDKAGKYESNKLGAQSADAGLRVDLAAREDVEPEILYYLADDAAPEVRKNIAGNPSTPVQANTLLTQDENVDVRMELARKICRLLPGLSAPETVDLLGQTIEILEILARDQLATVRAIVSNAIKDTVTAPRHIVLALAQDVEEIVAGPILEYSPLLSDDDLLEIIAAGVAARALPAIARRSDISEEVSAKVAASLEIPAIASLLANSTAKIREETLDQIVDQAEDMEDLHEPLVMRLDLSLRAIRRVAGFVAVNLVETLTKKHSLPPEIEKEIKQEARLRIEASDGFTPLPEESEEDSAAALFEAGLLNDEAVAEALDEKDHGFVTEALTLMSGYEFVKVQTMLASRNGKVVTSLCWKAGLSMRLAFKIQTNVAHVPRQEIVNAKGGIEYPFTDEEMDWQLSFYENQ